MGRRPAQASHTKALHDGLRAMAQHMVAPPPPAAAPAATAAAAGAQPPHDESHVIDPVRLLSGPPAPFGRALGRCPDEGHTTPALVIRLEF